MKRKFPLPLPTEPLSVEELQRARALWAKGRDTAEIARWIMRPEAVVASEIEGIKQRMQAA